MMKVKSFQTIFSVTTLFLILQLVILYRNVIDRNRSVKGDVDFLAYRSMQNLSKKPGDHGINALKTFSIDITRDSSWKENALMFKTPPLQKRFLTLGIPTIKRRNASYIFGTLESLLNHTSPNDLKDIYIVLHLADFDEVWKNKTANTLKSIYPVLVADGTLQIIQAPKSFYPNLDNLQHTYRDPESKRKWKSKQNADYAYLFMYSQNLATYYLQLEDDIYTVSGYYTTIKEYIAQHTEGWTCIEFSELGFIGKLFHSTDLEKLAKMTLLFYEEQPVDFTYMYFNIMMLQWERIIRRPTLFQHVGWHSSYPGRIQPLKDRYFDNAKKEVKGDNPPAKCFTTLTTVPDFSPQMAYSLEEGYFWSHDVAKAKDTFTVVFDAPQNIERVYIVTGSQEHPTDKIEHGILEASLTLVSIRDNKASCTNDISLGKFQNGTIDATGLGKKMGPFQVHCLKITITKDQLWWIIIREIAVICQKS